MDNQLNRMLRKVEAVPAFLRPYVKSKIIGFTVPFVGTAGISFDKTTLGEWQTSLSNSRKVRNHLKQVHAGAMILLAETTAVLLTAANMPDNRIPLVKKIEANFVKRSSGALKANSILTPDQQTQILAQDKGETVIDVYITDETGEQPVLVKVTSAWVPKKSRK